MYKYTQLAGTRPVPKLYAVCMLNDGALHSPNILHARENKAHSSPYTAHYYGIVVGEQIKQHPAS